MDAILTSTAVKHPSVQRANVLNYANFTKFSKNKEGKITAVHVKDKLNNQLLTIKAKTFINATGPFSDQIREKANPDLPPLMVPV